MTVLISAVLGLAALLSINPGLEPPQEARPVVAQPAEAEALARAAIAQNSLTSPADCYRLNTSRRADDHFVVNVSQKEGRTCEGRYPRAFKAFDIVIDARRGSAVLENYPGDVDANHEDIMFEITDVEELPPDDTFIRWHLTGSAQKLEHTDTCRLAFTQPAFERVTAYNFSLSASRQSRVLHVSYYAESPLSKVSLDGQTQGVLFLGNENQVLVSHPAALQAWAFRSKLLTSSDVSFEVELPEADAKAFLSALRQATYVAPGLQGQPIKALSMSLMGNFGVQDMHTDRAATAMEKCLRAIWR